METQTRTRRRPSSGYGRRPSSGGSARPSRGGSRRASSGGGNYRGGSRRGGGGGRGKKPSFDPRKFINTNPVEAKVEVYEPEHRFDTFGLDSRIVHALQSHGFEIPTPIQDQSIPAGLDGRDVLGLAATGTGKTAAFLLPMLHHTLKNPNRTTLILAPTRELAIQIDDEFRSLSRGLRLQSTVCVGGTPMRPQIQGLRRHNHFVIGTPGRVLDMLKRGYFTTETVQGVVLDEADRMLDMGFINDMKAILAWMPEGHQTMLYSATMNKATEGLVGAFMKNPVHVSVKKQDVTSSIEQNVIEHTSDNKYEQLIGLLKTDEFERVIVFGAMKRSVENLAKDIRRSGVRAESLHGDKNHGQRQRALRAFKQGEAKVLVATDVAARGIHVDNVSHVINYDLPNTFEDYVHRIGRTGRGDKKGKALTFVTVRRY